jgi:hypothetical protein
MWKIRVRSILILFILGAVLSVISPLVSVVAAAEITAPALHWKVFEATENKPDSYWPSDPVLCDFILDGEIKEGDAALLIQKFKAMPETDHFTYFLCLRSGGGDLQEAVKIAQFVVSQGRPAIATVVEDGQTCASACAVIFLAGNESDPGRHAHPKRFLHPRGRLLFHSSQLDLRRFSDKELLAILTEHTSDPRGLQGKIVDLYKDGLRDVQNVIATFQQFIYDREDISDRWVRPSLFLEMFALDPGEWICVDNLDAVGRWNIQIYGYQVPEPPGRENYANVCRSAYHWRLDEFAVGSDYDRNSPRGVEEVRDLKRPPASNTIAERNKRNAEFDDRVTMFVQARLEPLTCVIELHTTSKKLDTQSTLFTFFLANPSSPPMGTTIMSELSPTAFYPAATLLRDLPGVRPAPDRDASKTRPAVGFNEYPNAVMNGCSYKSIPNMERQACQAACAMDSGCVAYSHNEITRACELKHTLTALRLDPLSTSGASSAGPTPSRSIRAEAMIDFYALFGDKMSPSRRLKIKGKLIDYARVHTLEECSDRCKSDPVCLADQSWLIDDGYECGRFSDIIGVQEDPAANVEIEIDIKKQ